MINYYGPLSSHIGYGIAAHYIIKAIYQLGTDIIYWPIGNPEVDQDAELIQSFINNQRKYDTKFNTLTIWHQNLLHNRIGLNLNSALTFFEKNQLNAHEIMSMNTQDIIFAPSKWAYDIIKNTPQFKRECFHIPMGVDCDQFKLSIRDNCPTYKFFNIGKIEKRKGHDVLVDIFNKAFEKDDNVELVISWNNPFLTEEQHKEWESKYKTSKLGDKIQFIPRIHRNQMNMLYNTIDCGIFPTRAEGCGLPLMELLACGKPLITTNYSAHTDFCTSQNAMLVDIDGMEVCSDGVWFHGEGEWARLDEPQIDQFVEYMRKCYRSSYKMNIKGRQDMEERSWDKTAQSILKHISQP